MEHRIELKEGAQPAAVAQYRLPPKFKQTIQETVEQLIKDGHIEDSTSPWRAPVLVVIKKDGSPRVCMDYRMLNDRTKTHAYLMKFLDELLDTVAGHAYISTLDLTKGYYQIPMAEDSRTRQPLQSPV